MHGEEEGEKGEEVSVPIVECKQTFLIIFLSQFVQLLNFVDIASVEVSMGSKWINGN